MQTTLKRCLPALIASFVLVFAPACAGPRQHVAPGFDPGPIANPHVARRVAPRDPDVPRVIQRSAGQLSGDEALFLFYLFYYIFYGIVWCFVELARVALEDSHYHEHEDCDD